MQKVRRLPGGALTSLAVLAGFALASCGANEEEPAHKEAVSLSDLFSGIHAKYIRQDHPRDLNDSPTTTLSVAGVIVDVQPGPKAADADPDAPRAGRFVLLLVDVEAVGKGDAGTRQVRVLLHQGTREVAEYRATLNGLPVALYLAPATDIESSAPADLYVPVTPQGFIVGDRDGIGITYPWDHIVEPRQRLSEVAPGSR